MAKKEEYIYPPTQVEVGQAMRNQSKAIFNFYVDNNISVDKLELALNSAMFQLKHAHSTQKYSLAELKVASEVSTDKRMKVLFNHEENHAKQMIRVLKSMGIETIPEFDVYVCPIMADMYQSGNFMGLVSMREDQRIKLTREQVIDFDTQMAFEIIKSGEASFGDVVLVLGIVGGKVISMFKN